MPGRCHYFTTPIYYANGLPHAGHVYATLLAGILKKHALCRNEQVRFLTGLDEHGEAVARKASSLGIPPQQLVDELAVSWQQSFRDFHVDYDIFLRTTSPEHVKNVTDILNFCYQKGDIYYGEHEGYYCVQCESFLAASERGPEETCLIHRMPTELRREGNYFFRTTRYKEALKALISEGRITQQERFNSALLSLLEHLEGDLSISRPKTRLTWGIELPFDSDHVTYVWFDALPNYITGIGGLEAARTSPFWANAVHILGKDILKFHGIFWPAICLSLGVHVPRLLVTGWLLKDGHKMSKTLGSGLSVELIQRYGKDMFVNFVFRATNPGDDIDISWKSYFERYNADLANGVGNLLSRTLAMLQKYTSGQIPAFVTTHLTPEQTQAEGFIQGIHQRVQEQMENFQLADALTEIWKIVAFADKHIADSKPWDLAKKTDAESALCLQNVLATAVACLRAVGFLAYPFFPEKMLVLLHSIAESTQDIGSFSHRALAYHDIAVGSYCQQAPRLYDRVVVDDELAYIQTTLPNQPNAQAGGATGVPAAQNEHNPTEPTDSNTPVIEEPTIALADFAKVHIRVGTIVQAEFVEKSDKLLRIFASLGELGTRTILSGIRTWVRPEDIINKKVAIVTNLEPRQMKFGRSEGMLLTAETADGKVLPVYIPEEMREGSLLS